MQARLRNPHFWTFIVLPLLLLLALPATASAVPWTVGFGPLSTVTIGANPFDIASGDFNNDGFPDLVTADYGRPTVSVLLSDGSGGFSVPMIASAGADRPEAVAVGDFNQDGDLDVVVACYASAAVTLLVGDGTGALTLSTGVGVYGYPYDVAAGDLDNDGDLDIVTSLWAATASRSCSTSAAAAWCRWLR